MSPRINELMSRNLIGFEHLFNFAETAAQSAFPPHDIERISDNHYRLTLAVAGFSREELSMTLSGGHLVISGSKEPIRNDDARAFIYKGIAHRSFSQNFKIGDNVEVIGASLENGLLVIDLERQPPESQKSITIKIK